MADDEQEEKAFASPEAEAFDYRRQGASYSEIAEGMGISIKEAIRLVAKAVDALGIEPIITTRKLDIERVELMMQAVFQAASSGDIEAINTVTRLMEMREKLEKKTAAPPPLTLIDLVTP